MTLKTSLQPHQVAAVEKLGKIKVGALYMEMGTGKTRTALELIVLRANSGKINKVLWLCPCSVKPTIQKEIEKHCCNAQIYVCGIESLSASDRLYVELLDYVQKHNIFLVVDESNLVKNHLAIRTSRIITLAGHCKYKLILNGTPISKCEKDLFAQWYILDWRILGYKSFWSFAANHLEYDEKIPGKISRTLNTDYLVQKIAPYTYQVKKEECLNLPKKIYRTWYFEMPNAQALEYDMTKEKFLMQVEELEPTTLYKLFTALQHVVSGKRVISGLRQKICTVPIYNDPETNPRVQALTYIIDRIGTEKVIIWCKYTQEIKTISNILRKYYGENSTVEFYGEVSKKKRQEAEQKFCTESQYFVANKTCAGYGLNLQYCHNVIYYSNDWDFATRAQSEDRVHRIGQDKAVYIFDICASETIDERILKCLWRKENLVDTLKTKIQKNMDITELKKWIDGEEIG